MDPNINNTNSVIPPVAPLETQPTFPAAPPASTATTTNTEAINTELNNAGVSQSQPKKLNIPKIDPKTILSSVKSAPLKFKVMGGFVLTLIILLILASFTKSGKDVVKKLTLSSPSPIPAVTPIGEVTIPSNYASDSEVLGVESKLSDFDKKLGGTVLTEDTLRPPVVDWNVSFKN